MGVDNDWLRVCIADDADTLIPGKRLQFILKLRTEIVAFQIMNLSTETFLLVKHDHTGTLRTEVRVIVRTVEQVVYTALCTDGSKESSHTLLYI